MLKIKIDTEALKKNSSQISSQIAELQNLNTRLENLIIRIDSSWEGQACVSYINMLKGYSENAKKMINILTEYKKYVDSTIEKFSSIDKNSASSVRNSF